MAKQGGDAPVERIEFAIAGFCELCREFADHDAFGKLIVANQLQALEVGYFQRAAGR